MLILARFAIAHNQMLLFSDTFFVMSNVSNPDDCTPQAPCHYLGRREHLETPEQRRKTKPPGREAYRKFVQSRN